MSVRLRSGGALVLLLWWWWCRARARRRVTARWCDALGCFFYCCWDRRTGLWTPAFHGVSARLRVATGNSSITNLIASLGGARGRVTSD